MRYAVVLLAGVLALSVACDKETAEQTEQPEEEVTAAEAEQEAEEAEVAREEEHGRPMNFKASSEAFKDGEPLPAKYTCDGDGVSPPITWSQPPDGAESFAVVMTDPDAPEGTFHHWGVWAIPKNEKVLKENVPAEAEIRVTTPDVEEDGTVSAYQAKNDFDKIGYGAPCPPEGDDAHRYIFRVFALDHPGATFTEAPTVEQLIDELAADAIGEAEIVATYKRGK